MGTRVEFATRSFYWLCFFLGFFTRVVQVKTGVLTLDHQPAIVSCRRLDVRQKLGEEIGGFLEI